VTDRPLSQYLQQCVIWFSINNDKFLSVVSGLDFRRVFLNPIPMRFFAICVDFYKRYGTAPRKHFLDELENQIKDLSDDEKQLHMDFYKGVLSIEEPNMEYTLARLGQWVKEQKLKSALLDASVTLPNNPDLASTILRDALDSTVQFVDTGLNYFEDFSSLDSRGEGEEYLLSTGITELDKLIGGFCRGRFVVVMGAYKGLKSWALMHIGKTALFHGLKVLHISHEMSEREVEERYDQLISGFMVDGRVGPNKWPVEPNQPDGEWRVLLRLLGNGGVVAPKELVVPSVLNISTVIANRKRVKKLFGGDLRIKKYPPKTCSMDMLRSYINSLKHFDGFVPDVIINDYVDDMDLTCYDEQLRHQLNEAYLDHKKMADELEALVVTASQVNRKAIEAPVMDKRHFAEDLRKAGNVDLALGICRTAVMKRVDRANLFVVVNRTGAEGVWCQIGTGVQAGQFAIWSISAAEASQDLAEIEESVGREKDQLL